MADYPISAVHVLEIRKIKISDGNRFRTFMSFLIPAMLVKGADTAEHTVHLFDAITNITAWNPMKRLHKFFGRTLEIQNCTKSNRHRCHLYWYKDKQRAFARQ